MVDRSRLRQFIAGSFDEDELADLIFDYFPNVRPLLSERMSLGQKVRVLVDFADRHGRMDHLVVVLEKLRPEAYCEFFQTDLDLPPEPVTARRNPRQVFLSYANPDAEFANRLAADLRERGVDVWMAPDSILPGEKWVAAIERGLRESGIFLLVLSPEGMESKWVSQETQVAIMLENEGKMRIYPLRVRPADVPLLLSTRQHIAFDKEYDRGLAHLLAALRPGSAPRAVTQGSSSLDTLNALIPFPTLLIDRSNAPEDEVVLNRPAMTVGRAPDNDIVIDLPVVSSHHLRLEIAEVGVAVQVRVVDLGSSNGTFLGGRQLSPNVPEILMPGDMLNLGARKGQPVSLILRPEGKVGPLPIRPVGPVVSSMPAPVAATAARRGIPVWAYAAAGLALVALLGWLLLRGLGGGGQAQATRQEAGGPVIAVADTPTATTEPTPEPSPELTDVPTEAPTGTLAPTAEPTDTPTAEATTTATAEATDTSEPAQPVAGPANTTVLDPDSSLDFAVFGTWTRGAEANGTLTPSTEQAHSGEQSARLDYEFATTSNDYVVFQQEHAIEGQPNLIRVWVYGDGSGHYLNAWIIDQGGQTWQVPLGRVTHQGWRQMEGLTDVEQEWPWTHIDGTNNGQVDYPIRFRGLVLDDLGNGYTGEGTIYLDDLRVARGTAVAASTAAPDEPAATATTTAQAGDILFTSAGALMTADPGGPARSLGAAESNTCSSEAVAGGLSYRLAVPGPGCGSIGEGLAVCPSPNGLYEVLTSRGTTGRIVSVRTAGSEESVFVVEAAVDGSAGLAWSPGSSSFLFVVGDDMYQGFPDGGSRMLIDGQAAIICPRWFVGP